MIVIPRLSFKKKPPKRYHVNGILFTIYVVLRAFKKGRNFATASNKLDTQDKSSETERLYK